jgi:hypothetical protein
MRNLSERLERLEKAVPCDLIAFFSVPDKYLEVERAKIEKDLWNEYLKNGGDPKASPAFISGLTGEKEPMFLEVERRGDVLAGIEAGRRKLV